MSNDRIKVQAKIRRGTELAERWEEWADGYGNQTEAVKGAIRQATDDTIRTSALRGLYSGLVVLIVLLLGAIRALYDVQTMGVVFAVAMGAFALVYAGPRALARVREVLA